MYRKFAKPSYLSVEQSKSLELNHLLRSARYWYYVKKELVIKDEDYDKLKQELRDHVDKHPDADFINLVIHNKPSMSELGYTPSEKREWTKRSVE